MKVQWSVRRILPYVVGGLAGAVWVLLVKAGYASANDCIEYVKSMKNLVGAPKGVLEDCMRTGWVQGAVTSIIASVGGGAIAVGVGTALAGGGDKKEEGEGEGGDKKDEKKGGRPNPCQGEIDRAFKARAKRNFADTQLTQMRSRVTSLDTAYEQIRIQGYGGGVIDVGFMIASTITAGATAPIAQGLAEKLAEAAAMGLIKDQMKGLLKVLSSDKYTQADMMAALQAMPPNMAQKFLEEMMAGEALTAMMEKGLNPPGFDRNTKLLSEELTGPIAKSFMDSLSLLDTMATSNDYLDQMALIRKMITSTEQAISAIQHELQFNINPEIDSAHEGVTYCQSGDEYQKYLKGLAFDALPSQG